MSLTKAALSSKCFYLIYFSMLRDEDPQNRDPADAGSTQGSEAGREARAQGSGPSFGHHTLQTPPTLPPPFPTSSPKTFPRLSSTDSAEPTKGRAMSRRTADLREPPTASCLTPPGPAPPRGPTAEGPEPAAPHGAPGAAPKSGAGGIGPLRPGEAGRDAAAVPPAGPDAPVPGGPPSPSACHVRSPRRTAAQRPAEGLFPAGGCRVPPPPLNGSPAPSLRTSASGPCHSRQGGAGEGGRGLRGASCDRSERGRQGSPLPPVGGQQSIGEAGRAERCVTV